MRFQKVARRAGFGSVMLTIAAENGAFRGRKKDGAIMGAAFEHAVPPIHQMQARGGRMDLLGLARGHSRRIRTDRLGDVRAHLVVMLGNGHQVLAE